MPRIANASRKAVQLIASTILRRVVSSRVGCESVKGPRVMLSLIVRQSLNCCKQAITRFDLSGRDFECNGDVSPIENAPQSTKRILDTLHAMYRESRTVDKERRLRGRSQYSSRYRSVQRHQFDRRKSDRGTSTLAGIALEKAALLHEPGFLQEIALGRAAQDALRRHYPICRIGWYRIANECNGDFSPVMPLGDSPTGRDVTHVTDRTCSSA